MGPVTGCFSKWGTNSLDCFVMDQQTVGVMLEKYCTRIQDWQLIELVWRVNSQSRRKCLEPSGCPGQVEETWSLGRFLGAFSGVAMAAMGQMGARASTATHVNSHT